MYGFEKNLWFVNREVKFVLMEFGAVTRPLFKTYQNMLAKSYLHKMCFDIRVSSTKKVTH